MYQPYPPAVEEARDEAVAMAYQGVPPTLACLMAAVEHGVPFVEVARAMRDFALALLMQGDGGERA